MAVLLSESQWPNAADNIELCSYNPDFCALPEGESLCQDHGLWEEGSSCAALWEQALLYSGCPNYPETAYECLSALPDYESYQSSYESDHPSIPTEAFALGVQNCILADHWWDMPPVWNDTYVCGPPPPEE